MTDAKIQQIVRTEFRDKTLICIAREYSTSRESGLDLPLKTTLPSDRLRTILHYDRVVVMSAGNVAEFNTPMNLFLKGGLFWQMCVNSDIDIIDIQKASVTPSFDKAVMS